MRLKSDRSLVMYILLSIVTCGIYSWIWYYSLGNRLQENAPRYGLSFSENGTSFLCGYYLVLSFFGRIDMKLFKYAIHILILGILLLVFYNCPFRFFLGISCLGCGMTRGLLCALRFQFQKAFYYHPLFWIVPIYVIGALLDYFGILKLSSKTKNIIYTITIFLFIIAYLFRLFHGHEAVNWNIQDGLLYQLIVKKFL